MASEPLPEKDPSPVPLGEKAPPETPAPESKIRKFLRTLLRWAIAVLVVFGLGILLSLLLFYLPKTRELRQANQNLQEAQAQVSTLESQIAALENQIEALNELNEINQSLRTELDSANQHVILLTALTNAYAAQLALAEDDTQTAQTHLDQTAAALASLEPALGAGHPETFDTIQRRLALVLEGLDSNAFAAQSDLQVLINLLIQWEADLFAK